MILEVRMILGCDLLSDWSASGDGNGWAGVGALYCLIYIVTDNVLECFEKTKTDPCPLNIEDEKDGVTFTNFSWILKGGWMGYSVVCSIFALK